MIKNIYFNVVEKIAKELNLPCDKHNPHSWMGNHPYERYVTFNHKVLFLIFESNGKYRIEAGLDMDFEVFKILFGEMEKFIHKVKKEVAKGRKGE